MFSKLKTKLSKDSTCTATNDLETASTISATSIPRSMAKKMFKKEPKTTKTKEDEPTKTHVYAAHAFALRG